MNAAQFNKTLTKLGIPQIALAEKLEINERTVRSWVGGRSKVPTTIAALLNLMIDTDTPLEKLRL